MYTQLDNRNADLEDELDLQLEFDQNGDVERQNRREALKRARVQLADMKDHQIKELNQKLLDLKQISN